MYEDEVPALMKEAYGDASDRIKIFMILREPIARAQSYYYADMGTDLEAYDSFQGYIQTQLNMSSNYNITNHDGTSASVAQMMKPPLTTE